MNGQQYDVVLQVQWQERVDADNLRSVHVRGRNGEMIPLSSVITAQETLAPKELNRFNQTRVATISATPNPGYSLGDGLAAPEMASARVLPAGVLIDYWARAASSSSPA
jgi:multidrug efflux pump